MKAPVYMIDGQLSEPLTLDEALFDLKWNASLVQQVVLVAQGNARVSRAKTKDRSEVRGGGKKPWPQKYTGRARHGSIRSPIWVGGGITFGPTPARHYKRRVNKKMAAKALFTVLSSKLKEQELFILKDEFSLKEAKTKAAHEIVSRFLKTVQPKFNGERVLVITPDTPDKLWRRATRNIASLQLANPVSVSALLLLRHKYIMVSKASLATLVNLRGQALKLGRATIES